MGNAWIGGEQGPDRGVGPNRRIRMRIFMLAAIAVLTLGLIGPSAAALGPASAVAIGQAAGPGSPATSARCSIRRWCGPSKCHRRLWCR
jgi:hypothetical protein